MTIPIGPEERAMIDRLVAADKAGDADEADQAYRLLWAIRDDEFRSLGDLEAFRFAMQHNRDGRPPVCRKPAGGKG